jgi:hypothetical protein
VNLHIADATPECQLIRTELAGKHSIVWCAFTSPDHNNKLTLIARVERNRQVHLFVCLFVCGVNKASQERIETRIGTGQLLKSVVELLKQDHNIKIFQILLGQI